MVYLNLNRQVVKQVVAGVDFGFVNPGVILTFAVDGDKRLYLIHEVYRTQKTIDWWVVKAQELYQAYKIEEFICDPSEPAYITQLNEAGLSAVAAPNAIVPGIDALKSRLQIQRDGRPRFYVYADALHERDELREEAHQPVSFEDEMSEYIWDAPKEGRPIKEVPLKLNDHAMDAARYVCLYMAQFEIDTLDRDTAEAISSFRGL